MKKIIAISVFSAFVLGAATNASAFWGGDDDYECYGPYGKIPGCNPYDEWDPRYWMEEMEDVFDDDDDYRYGGGGYGRGYGGPGYGGPGYGGYQQPYGGGYQQPYYGGGYQQPYYGGGYQQPYAAPAVPAVPAAPQQ